MTTGPHAPSMVPQDQPLWRCIYIAKDHTGSMQGIILAPSHAIASAYFLGTGLSPHSVEVIDPCNQTQGSLETGVCIIATAETVSVDGSRFGERITKLVR